MEPIRSYCSASVGLPLLAVGRLLHYTFRGLLSVYSRYGLHARQVAYATLYTRGSDDFVSSVAALIATGWSEPAPGRDFHPLRTSAFHGAPQTCDNAWSIRAEVKDIFLPRPEGEIFPCLPAPVRETRRWVVPRILHGSISVASVE
jgi:hypothetical protein